METERQMREEGAGGHVPSGFAGAGRRTLPLDEDLLARFRARQIDMVLRLTPLTACTNLMNVAVVAVLLWHTTHRGFLVAWAFAIAVLICAGARAWAGRRRRVGERALRASPRAERHAIRHAVLMASVWAALPAVALPGATAGVQGLIGCICLGMTCAGGFALASVPWSGFLFPAILSLGTAIGVLRSPGLPHALLVTMLALYVVVIGMSVRSTYRSFWARLEAEAAAERQRDVVGLLLNDFESHASDALWEADASARLCHVSVRLCEILGQPAHALVGRSLVSLFDTVLREPGDEWIDLLQEVELPLARHLADARPFHDLVLPLRADAGDVPGRGWVQLSARPLIDAAGGLQGWRGVASNVTEAHEARRHVSQLAFKDMVTGLHNRHAFQIRLGQMMAQPGEEQPCAVVCMDLDGFKLVNDALGHDIGDGLLRSVAVRLSGLLLPCDLFARLGGDEFGLILDGVVCADEAAARAAALLSALRTPLEVSGASVPIGASLGVAMAPRDGCSAEVILKNADLALYAAKAAGRGQYRFYEPGMGARVQHRLTIERALRDALRRDQLSLAFQPQLDLASADIVGFEVLLRWQHPELGHVSPADFIPVAEDAGLINDIGAWVLRRACVEAAGWTRPLRVAVNLSPLQIMAQDLGAVVRSALDDSGLAPARLEVEVTESVLMNEAAATLAQLHALHDLGARIALDDFGTGYSSMAYLRRFPFDKLKIDRAFVRELIDGADARAIVRAMLDLAAALRMDTVAEGVENPQELALLHQLGCRAVQGYLIARPMRSDEVAPFLMAWADHPVQPWLRNVVDAPARSPAVA